MPFLHQLPREYSRKVIEELEKGQIGVYVLFKQAIWIYVGRGDLRECLLGHLNGDNPCVTRFDPTSWMAEVTGGDPTERHKQLVEELQPACPWIVKEQVKT